MILRELLRDCEIINIKCKNEEIAMAQNIRGLAYDSRKVEEGYLFIAIQGEKNDGHNFILEAIKKGATAVVHEKPVNYKSLSNGNSSIVKFSPVPLELEKIAFIKVKNSRKTLAYISNNFYERPSEHLTLIGITGTNGKTTTSYILKSILDCWGKNIGLIGTIQYMIKDKVYPAIHTTPESPEFQKLLKDMLLSECNYIISEVSSHALAQYRVDGTRFQVAVFTNLTRDHLDFHRTMEAYFQAKKRLFFELLKNEGVAIINLDDDYGRILKYEITKSDSRLKILTYGLRKEADLVADDIKNTFDGLRFQIIFRNKSYRISSHLTGIPNVYNIMSAAGSAIALGVPWEVVVEGIEKIKTIKGRFEKVDLGQDFLCIVDYAHTEDALERLILTAKELLKLSPVYTQNSEVKKSNSNIQNTARTGKGMNTDSISRRIITVFGCGGNRDRGKRPIMGEIATRLSDFVIITSDNPRFEDPIEIIKDIQNGITHRNYIVEPDRKEAIKKAIEMAEKGDIILIAGKGHEDYQEIKGIRYEFSDRIFAEQFIKERMQARRRNLID